MDEDNPAKGTRQYKKKYSNHTSAKKKYLNQASTAETVELAELRRCGGKKNIMKRGA